MGLWNRIKKAFDNGGVGVSVATEKSFRWSHDLLPIDVTITNSSDEPRVINSVRFQLVEYDRDNLATTRKVRGRYGGLNFFVSNEFTVGAGEEHKMHVDMPLSIAGAAETVGVDDAPDWVKGLSGVVNAVADLSRDHEWYLLRVIPEVEGFTARKIGSRRIRNLRAGEWGDGMITTNFDIG